MKRKPPIRTAIIVDEMASQSSTRDEIKEHVGLFEELLGRKLDIETPTMFYPDSIRIGTELILFDYGGMGVGNDLLPSNSRRLVRWAIDNPSALHVGVGDPLRVGRCWLR